MVQTVGEMLQTLAEMDIFFYVLPFLLMFALVYAILQKLKLTGEDERGINAVIALAVALMALQFDIVPLFFQNVFPRIGMGLAVILAALIFVGLFVKPQEHQFAVWTFFGLGAAVFIIVLLQSFEDYSWWSGGWWYDNMPMIITAIIVLAFVFLVVGTKGEGKPFKSVSLLEKDS